MILDCACGDGIGSFIEGKVYPCPKCVIAERDRFKKTVSLLREAIRSLAHGENSGREYANKILAATAEEE